MLGKTTKKYVNMKSNEWKKVFLPTLSPCNLRDENKGIVITDGALSMRKKSIRK